MIDADLNTKYPLEGSGTRWDVAETGWPGLWVDTRGSGYEIAWIDQHGMYNGPAGIVLAADIVKLAQATAEFRHALEAERIVAKARGNAGASTTVRIPPGTGTLTYVRVPTGTLTYDEAVVAAEQVGTAYDLADIEFDDDSMWEVTRDGADTATIVSGYNDGDRGRLAIAFASDDDAGWANGNYDEFLCVRRCKPDPERDGVIARVRVQVKT
jgi:hypothetical protein